jgi:hypothetical protein
MADNEQATHRHKRLGEVVILSSTEQLAHISTSSGAEKLWVKLTDLAALADEPLHERTPKKPRGTKRHREVH